MPRIKKPKWVPLTIEHFKKGAIVRVHPDIKKPIYGWGAVKPLEEGIIISNLDSYKDFSCAFPSQTNWSAKMREMEIKVR